MWLPHEYAVYNSRAVTLKGPSQFFCSLRAAFLVILLSMRQCAWSEVRFCFIKQPYSVSNLITCGSAMWVMDVGLWQNYMQRLGLILLFFGSWLVVRNESVGNKRDMSVCGSLPWTKKNGVSFNDGWKDVLYANLQKRTFISHSLSVRKDTIILRRVAMARSTMPLELGRVCGREFGLVWPARRVKRLSYK